MLQPQQDHCRSGKRKTTKINIHKQAQKNFLRCKEWTHPSSRFQASIVEGKEPGLNMSMWVKKVAKLQAWLLLIGKGLENLR